MTSRRDQIHGKALDILAAAMQRAADEDTIGYVVLSYDETPDHGQTQVESASVLGFFPTEMEAVTYAEQHFREVNRGVPEGSKDGWLTLVKPVIEARP